MTATAAGAEAGDPEPQGRPVSAAPCRLEAPEIVHDGKSYRIYRAVLPATSFGNGDAPAKFEKGSPKKVSVAIKACRPGGDPVALFNLNNEYNILRVGRMANCGSVRTVLKRDKCFVVPPDADDRGTAEGSEDCGGAVATAIYFEWVEGATLSDWLEGEERNHGGIESESERLLEKVRVASKLAGAVADVHEGGIVHNDLNEDNVIVSFANDIDSDDDDCKSASRHPCRVTLIDFKYAEESSGLEGTDEGDRVNYDIPRLATLLRNIFATKDGGDGDARRLLYGASENYDPMAKRLSFGHVLGDFRGTFQNNDVAGGDFQSCHHFDDEDRTTVTDTGDVSLTSSDGNPNYGVSYRVDPGDADGELGDASLPTNLPRSVRRVLADAQDVGHGARETVYRNAREVAEDLQQMASDPTVFLADPRREHTVKSAFRRPPRRLYGKENELATLRNAETRLTDENRGSKKGVRTEVVLIAGRSGTGKSSLLRQARSDSRGVFVVGKFDQLRSMQPYSALIAAFDQIVHSIVAEDTDVVGNIKKDIMKAVGSNGKVLTDVIPSLVKVIGEQPAVAHVTGIEAQNRFRYIAQCFARAICTPQRPLIFVLDDLQWCDPASIDLVKTLVTDKSNKYLLFIGCYRDDEMKEDNHVSAIFDSMKKANVPFTKIELGNMDEDSMASFISERLRLPRRLTKSLSEIVHRKSLGNAFFATTFLQTLAEGGTLTFSPAKMRWIWDEAEADAKNISDDVSSLMAEKIQALQPSAAEILKKASCIGATFDTSILRHLMTEAPNGTLDNKLDKLAKQGLIIKMRRRGADEGTTQYKFSHDRIQQAAYSVVPKHEKEVLHRRIGKILEKELKDTTSVGLIFKTVDQLNRGLSMADHDEQVELAELNARAAQEAYDACAFAPSTAYAQKSLDIIGGEGTAWNNHYNLALTLHNLLAELKICEGNFNEAKHISQSIFKRAKSFDDRFIGQMCNLKSMFLRGDLDDCVTSSLGVLRELGVPLPSNPSTGAVLVELIKTKRALWTKSDTYISSLPEMTDERIIKTLKILTILGYAAYQLGSLYTPIVTFKGICLMLKHGLSDNAPLALTAYGFLIFAIQNDVQQACRFGKLGLSLASKATIPQSCTFMYGFILHWRDNISLTLDPLRDGYESALEIGDIQYACYNALICNVHRLHSGQVGIQTIIEQQKASLQELTKAARSSLFDMLRPTQQAALNLTRSDAPVVLSGDVMDEEDLLRRSVESSNELLEYYIRVNAACVAYIFGDYACASVHSLKIKDIANKFPAIYIINVQAFYDAMSSFALARTATNPKKWRERGRRTMKKFVKWARDCPSNNAHKVVLLKAEDSSLLAAKSKKKKIFAEQAYEAAILGARKMGSSMLRRLHLKEPLNFTRESVKMTYFQVILFRRISCSSNGVQLANVNVLQRNMQR